MLNRLLHLPRQQFALFICCGMIVALIYSKFALTVGMILLLLMSLLEVNPDNAFPFRLNSNIKENFRQLWKRKDFLVVTLFFFIILASSFYSSDFEYLTERLRIKLPFLLLPFAFVSLPSFTEKQYFSLFYTLIIIASFSAILVSYNYAINFQVITKSLFNGKAIPTPTNHIRYSLIIALSVLSGAILWWKGFYLKYKWERHLIASLSILLFIFLHVLSVRSGLAVFYISGFFLILRFIFLSKRYLLGMLLLAGIFTAPFLAYKTVPSLHNKITYMQYDIDQYLNGNKSNLSDSERFISMELGLDIGNRNPVFGVGAGDLKQEMKNKFKLAYPDIEKPKMPHNQFISVYAGTGIVGLILFCFAFFFPLWYKRNYRDALFCTIHIILFFSFFIENTIEAAVGVAFYSLFLLTGLNYLKLNKIIKEG